MSRIAIVAALVVSAHLFGCASMNVSKKCFANGVCRVEKNGQVSYEGPPDKVAEMQAQEEGKKQAVASVDQAYADAPKRPATEPIRLVLVGPTAATPELAAFAGAYRSMIETALQGDPRIQLVPYEQVKLLVEAQSGDRVSSFGKPEVRSAVDEQLTRRLRDGNAEVDIALVAYLTPKKVSGFVGGKGGVGVAEVVNVEFQASFSSIYRFEELKSSEVGKSTDSLSVAGIGKDGKKSSGELKGKRNPESDRPAIQALSGWVKTTITNQLAASLPSLAAVKEIREKNKAAAMEKAPDWMKKLMMKKQ